MEERRPVDVVDQIGDIDLVERPGAGERRSDDGTVVEVVGARVGACVLDAQTMALDLGPLVRVDHACVLGVEVAHELLALVRIEQLGDHAGRTTRIGHVDDRAAFVGRGHPERGVDPTRRGPTDEQWHREALTLHLGRDIDHLVEGWCDQAGEPDRVGAALAGGVEDRLGVDHHAEVDDVVVRAAEHHADDVLADVVHVALHRREHDGAVRVVGDRATGRDRGLAFRLEEGSEVARRPAS